jgi:septal ring factor EnvC (AmiA/AmiB activator)
VTELQYTVNGGRHPEITGTYLHPKLMINLAQWCSDEYGIYVADIMLAHHSQETAKLLAARDAELQASREQVQKKRGKISALRESIEQMREEANRRHAKDKKKINRLLKMGNRQLSKLDHQESQLDTIGTKLDVARHDRVVLTSKNKDKNTLVIMRLFKRHRKSCWNNYVIRGKQQTINSRIAKVQELSPIESITLLTV